MARTRTGKQHKGVMRVTQKNGDVYIYERITAYNPETRKTYTVSKTLLGKILAGESEMIPTRPKKESTNEVSKDIPLSAGTEPNNARATATEPNNAHATVTDDYQQPVTASQRRAGSTDILNWIGKESGLASDLRNCFPLAQAQKIDSIAQYWLLTDGDTIPHIESWQLTHALPYPNELSEDICSSLFNDLALKYECGIQSFFDQRAARRATKRPIIVLHTSSVDTYSKNQFEFSFGVSQESGKQLSFEILTMMDVDGWEPICFEQHLGNTADVSFIKNSLDQFKTLTDQNALVVTDGGFYSENIIGMYCKHRISFLTCAPIRAYWIREAFDDVKSSITSDVNLCSFDRDKYCKTIKLKHTFEFKRECSRDDYKAGEMQPITETLYVHFIYSETRALEERVAFVETIASLIKDVESGVELSETQELAVAKYLFVERDGETGEVKSVSRNSEAIDKRKLDFGHFALVSNTEMDCFTALKYFRMRTRLENLYEVQKNTTDGERSQIWSAASLRGRQFVQFVSICYNCFFQQRINQLKDTLGLEADGKTQSELNEEKNLKKWLEEKSLRQIFEWFDAVSQLTVSTPLAKIVITSETTNRDQLFLKKLGVIPE